MNLVQIGASYSKTLTHFWQALEWSKSRNFCLFTLIIFQNILNLPGKVGKINFETLNHPNIGSILAQVLCVSSQRIKKIVGCYALVITIYHRPCIWLVEFLKGNFQHSFKSCARFSNENHVVKIRVWLLHVKMLFLYIHAQVDTEFFCPFPISFFYNSRPIHNGIYRTLQF